MSKLTEAQQVELEHSIEALKEAVFILEDSHMNMSGVGRHPALYLKHKEYQGVVNYAKRRIEHLKKEL